MSKEVLLNLVVEVVERAELFSVSAEEAAVALVTLRRALDQLTDREMVVFERHFIRGLSAGEIARADGVTEGSVRSAIRRARKKIAGAIGRSSHSV